MGQVCRNVGEATPPRGFNGAAGCLGGRERGRRCAADRLNADSSAAVRRQDDMLHALPFIACRSRSQLDAAENLA
ncbi:hypothetical protein IWGMT90018_45630 [Mycobacterium kiyosense]|nr:hypothetical protein IWGMT90018_45630 [Mycobacterium kiyosense]